MPNWCMNILLVSGDKKDIDLFYYKAWGLVDDDEFQALCFENFVPIEDFNVQKSYDLWGTKWEPDVGSHNRDDNRLTYHFSTANQPPVEWLMAASEQHPHLYFELRYFESGAGIAGLASGQDSIISNEMWDITDEDLELFGMVP